ncbi:MAG TPA: M50 family metallopeptidase [Myxococcales bacterium]|nr:M50 family metallopeptidase [Myxococcales bacterium]
MDRAGHHLDTPLLVALAVSFVAGLVFWTAWPLWPFRLLVVLMHESGHAAATLLVGGSVERIQVRPDEAGVTLGRIVPSMWRQIVVSSAGYVGSTVSGCVLLWLAARSRTGRWPLLALAAWTGLVAILWVRDGFTLLFVGGAAFALGMVARYGPSLLRRALLVFLATFSVSYALYDIKDDLLHLASRGPSDASALARVTFIPAIVWGVGWGLLSLGLVALTLRHILAWGPPGGALAAETSGASEHSDSAPPPEPAATGPTEW